MPKAGTYATPRLDLGAALEEYPLGMEGVLIADEILPVRAVPKKAAAFSAITRESILRTRDVKRGKGAAYSRDTFDTDDISYRCEEYGHEQQVDDEDREFYASDFDCDMVAAALCRDIVAREREARVAAKLFNTTTFTGAALFTDLATDWDNAASTIVDDVFATKEIVRRNCGMSPNTMVISAAVVPWIKKNTDLKARLQYVVALTESAIVGALAEILGIPNILVAGAVKSTANEGLAFAGSDIWSDNYAWLGVVPRTENMAEPGVGRTLLWNADSPDLYTVDEYYEDQTRSNIIRVRQHLDEKIIDPYFGHLLQIDT